jgi:hypothetical protein
MTEASTNARVYPGKTGCIKRLVLQKSVMGVCVSF